MAPAKSYPVRFTAKGLSDAFDSTETFSGACSNLQNLIPDHSNPDLMISRPGVGPAIVDMSTKFTTPTQITVAINIGNYIFGMVSSADQAGKDVPFCYLIGTGFITVTGATGANVPTSPATTGDWSPPTMAVVGGSNYIGWIDITNIGAPVYSAGNTSTNGLPIVPVGVANYNNRAYFICGNKLYYSDSLDSTKMTNAGQMLTVGDTAAMTALVGLPVQTSSAGIVAVLIAFKGNQVWQISGDAAISGSLAQNFITLNFGTSAPRSVVQTPIGIIFIGFDGPYLINTLGLVAPLKDEMKAQVADIQAPFLNANHPSRAAAAFSGSIYRVCLDVFVNGITVTQDFWYDIARKKWSGPHTFGYDCITQTGGYFIVASRNVGAFFFASYAIPNPATTYNDNGVALTYIWETSGLPKTPDPSMKQIVESTIEIGSIARNTTYLIIAQDENKNIITSVSLTLTNNNSVWGSNKWGDGSVWNAIVNKPLTVTIPWNIPLVFKKVSFKIIVTSLSAFCIGVLTTKYQDAGYLNQ